MTRTVHWADTAVTDDAASDLLSDAGEALAELIDGGADGDSSHCLRMK